MVSQVMAQYEAVFARGHLFSAFNQTLEKCVNKPFSSHKSTTIFSFWIAVRKVYKYKQRNRLCSCETQLKVELILNSQPEKTLQIVHTSHRFLCCVIRSLK